jgi:hypothetical protein
MAISPLFESVPQTDAKERRNSIPATRGNRRDPPLLGAHMLGVSTHEPLRYNIRVDLDMFC